MSGYVIGGCIIGLSLSFVAIVTTSYLYKQERDLEVKTKKFKDSQNYLIALGFFVSLFYIISIVFTYIINIRFSKFAQAASFMSQR